MRRGRPRSMRHSLGPATLTPCPYDPITGIRPGRYGAMILTPCPYDPITGIRPGRYGAMILTPCPYDPITGTSRTISHSPSKARPSRSQSITHYNQNGAKNLDLRCVLRPIGAGGKPKHASKASGNKFNLYFNKCFLGLPAKARTGQSTSTPNKTSRISPNTQEREGSFFCPSLICPRIPRRGVLACQK